ncbi:hypothetical protein Kpol_541p16 [Vanderwaltozyma polyspora DSM 70294]|uniref:Major facilitator superfamily (MFS) profile domain-containing protein n=1 Tax=Vanderwaltozyma polyspora (strain ATCC 22028 / DSM 70294 / BCRC 21397 / CBS 2163 / NBRC 10782 / NRRL Y-8283 / UCD 57-17) TaxID=436907 RepID=A7TIW1_VANPO|nr:uncharacterized protein Kpol_541p16 [Vanderwaltozyma polyspora DSM 70294]EDO17773.1 hypothetical protein Kpol_541p16 [Vanderwaltozyma polyspora DSM 70294]
MDTDLKKKNIEVSSYIAEETIRSDCSDANDESPSMELKNSSLRNPDYFNSTTQEYAFIFSCMLSQLLNLAGTTQTLSIMNVLTRQLHSSDSLKVWLVASFPLVSGSFILVSGRLGDIYGLKKMLILGYVILVIWSLITGLSGYSHSGIFFIIARAFQGLGISLVLPNVLGLIGMIYKPGTLKKNMVISIVGAMSPIGATLGGLFSGLVATESEGSWPWAFYAYTLAAFINTFISYYSIPNNIPTNVNRLSMDWIGSFTGVLGLILFNFVWNQAPADGWNSAYLIVLLVISVIALIAFGIYELRYAENPLLPSEIIRNRQLIMILTAMTFGWGSFGIWTFYYFSFVLNLRNYSPLWAGGSYFIFVISGTITAISCGFLMKKIRPAVLLTFSMVGFNLGCIIFSVTPVHQTYFRNILGTMIILPLGMDLSFPASSIILSDNLPNQHQGMAGSLVNTVINYSNSLFLGIAGTVEQHCNKNGTDLLRGYRGALYFGIACSGVAVLIAGLYMVETIFDSYKDRKEKDCENCEQ